MLQAFSLKFFFPFVLGYTRFVPLYRKSRSLQVLSKDVGFQMLLGVLQGSLTLLAFCG